MQGCWRFHAGRAHEREKREGYRSGLGSRAACQARAAVGSWPFRRAVPGFLLERFPDSFIANETLFIRRFLPGFQETRIALRNLGAGFRLFAHKSPFVMHKIPRRNQKFCCQPLPA